MSRTAAGTLADFGGGAVPYGWLLCDGAPYDAVSNPSLLALFNRISPVFGGTSSAFPVPDLRRMVTMGSGGTQISGPATTPGSTGGVEEQTLTAAQSGLPGHGHAASASTSTSGTVNASQNTGGAQSIRTGQSSNQGDSVSNPFNCALSVSSSTSVSVTAVAAANASTPLGNIQPSLVVVKMIKW